MAHANEPRTPSGSSAPMFVSQLICSVNMPLSLVDLVKVSNKLFYRFGSTAAGNCCPVITSLKALVLETAGLRWSWFEQAFAELTGEFCRRRIFRFYPALPLSPRCSFREHIGFSTA